MPDSSDEPEQTTPPERRAGAQLEKKRRRPALACEECRRRKVRCCRNIPCTNCIRAHRSSQCTYQAEPQHVVRRTAPPLAPAASRPGNGSGTGGGNSNEPVSSSVWPYLDVPRQPDLLPASSIAEVDSPFTGSSVPVTLAAPSSKEDASESGRRTPSSHFSGSSTITLLTDRVRELEERLSQVLGTSTGTSTSKLDSNPPRSNALIGALPVIQPGKGTLAKTRYYGPSHYLQSACLIFVLPPAQFSTQLDIIKAEETFRSPLWEPLARCKRLGRAIKAARLPAVVPQTPGSRIPSREICDKLVDGYLRTFETVYRILHVPSFLADYRRYWENPAGAYRTFVVQMQLVMAIGACLYDERFSLRQLAIQWIMEGQYWVIAPSPNPSPSLKSRLTLSGLQNMCLLHFARETTAIGADLVWISVGELYRSAVYMGLHRDPDCLVPMSKLRAELRRRLWITILEISLQASIDSGGPAAISLSDFDTKPPSNYDDDQLVGEPNGREATSGPKPADCFTQSSVQIALYRSFPTRLAIAHYLNDFRCRNVYDMTLRLSTEMSTACRSLAVVLQSFRPRAEPERPNGPSDFQLLLTEQAMHRYLTAMHIPWQAASQRDPRYYFSRKISVETSLKMHRALNFKNILDGSPASPESASPPPISPGRADYRRVCINGAGPYRAITYQSNMILAAELFWQLEEERAAKLSTGIERDLSLPSYLRVGSPTGTGTAQPSSGDASGGGIHSSSVGGSSAPPTTIGLGVVPYQELIEALRFAGSVTGERLEAGETNIKGHLFFHSLIAHADSLQRGESDAEIRQTILKGLGEGAGRCYEILKAVAARMENGPVPEDERLPLPPLHASAAQAGGGRLTTAVARLSSGGEDGGGDVDMAAADAPFTPEDERLMAFGAMADNGFGLDTDMGDWEWDSFLKFDIQGLTGNLNLFQVGVGTASADT